MGSVALSNVKHFTSHHTTHFSGPGSGVPETDSVNKPWLRDVKVIELKFLFSFFECKPLSAVDDIVQTQSNLRQKDKTRVVAHDKSFKRSTVIICFSETSCTYDGWGVDVVGTRNVGSGAQRNSGMIVWNQQQTVPIVTQAALNSKANNAKKNL